VVEAHSFSPKLVADAAVRVAWLALGVAIAIPAVQVFHLLVQPDLVARAFDQINRLVGLLAMLAAAGVFVLHRYRVLTPSAILRLGMVLEVLVALALALVETAVPPAPGQPVLGMSSVGPWIVAVGAFVPNPPTWTLAAGLTAATMWPIAYVINLARFDLTPAPWGQVAVWPVFNYLMAGLGYLVGQRLYGITVSAQSAADVGSYRLISRLGEGGMGEVWTASHRMLARAAAVKLLRPDSTRAIGREADTAAARLRREATIIATLQSPHTVYVYDFGVSDDGRFYYAMELVDGVSLHSLVANFGPLPAGRVVPILEQICESLEEAHQHGVVHRDLKPSNVMLCKVALAYDFVKVLDFGLAKRVENVTLTQQLTLAGTATGTPGYIAPEVALGEGTVDRRADIYALGCVAYFLLAGVPVFDEENPTKLALLHVQVTPDPPSQRTPLPIPPDLEAIVMRCLAKRPSDRPSSAAEVGRLLAGLQVARWSNDEARAWWDEHLPPSSPLRSSSKPGGRSR
jgi:serine/threonine-protein kinase